MTMQMTVGLPSKKVYEYLLRYFTLKKSINVERSEPSYILLRAGKELREAFINARLRRIQIPYGGG